MDSNDILSRSIRIHSLPLGYKHESILKELSNAGEIIDYKLGKNDIIITFSNKEAREASELFSDSELDGMILHIDTQLDNLGINNKPVHNDNNQDDNKPSTREDENKDDTNPIITQVDDIKPIIIQEDDNKDDNKLSTQEDDNKDDNNPIITQVDDIKPIIIQEDDNKDDNGKPISQEDNRDDGKPITQDDSRDDDDKPVTQKGDNNNKLIDEYISNINEPTPEVNLITKLDDISLTYSTWDLDTDIGNIDFSPKIENRQISQKKSSVIKKDIHQEVIGEVVENQDCEGNDDSKVVTPLNEKNEFNDIMEEKEEGIDKGKNHDIQDLYGNVYIPEDTNQPQLHNKLEEKSSKDNSSIESIKNQVYKQAESSSDKAFSHVEADTQAQKFDIATTTIPTHDNKKPQSTTEKILAEKTKANSSPRISVNQVQPSNKPQSNSNNSIFGEWSSIFIILFMLIWAIAWILNSLIFSAI